MARRRNPLVRNGLYCLTRFFFSLTRLLPLPLARCLGIGLAGITYYCLPRVKKVGLANIDLAYGDTLSDAEKRRILWASVRNLGLVAAEFSHIPDFFAPGAPPPVKFKGLDLVDQTKGAILMGAHQGNWELLLPASRLLNLKVAAVVRDFDEPGMNALVNRVRQAGGAILISKYNALGTLLSEIRNGTFVGLLADQSPRKNAAPVTFFGRQTWASIGPALLAMRANAPIHPVSVIRTGAGRYLLEFHPALELVRSDSFIHDLQVNTQRCQDAIEALVRDHPGQWLWLHRRWKGREHLDQIWKEREMKEAAEGSSVTAADNTGS